MLVDVCGLMRAARSGRGQIRSTGPVSFFLLLSHCTYVHSPEQLSVNMHQGLLRLFHIFKTKSRRGPLADNIDIRSLLSSSL